MALALRRVEVTDFLMKHPGGPTVLLFSHCRDATVAIHAGHRDPARTVLPILRKYKIESKNPRDVLKKSLGIPQFLLPENFNALKDIPSFDFERKDCLLNKARKLITAPGVQVEIRRLDHFFDLTIFALIAMYAVLLLLWLKQFVPWYVSVPAFAILRTSLAGGGHYYLHRGTSKLDILFDINYVGTASTAIDGHLLHHMYTQSDADVKRGFFGGMMGVPRLVRMQAHTLHKLGHVTSGMLLKGFTFEFDSENAENQGVYRKLRQMRERSWVSSINWRFWLLQALLRLELLAASSQGLLWSWLGQFIVSMWMNTFLVVSSHDFEDVKEEGCKDWAKFQLLNTHDMSITGNCWLDCFLSAGLAPHRAHHIFPYQRSGFANIYSNRFLEAASKQHGLPWALPKNLFTEILPDVFRQLMAPVCDPVSRKRTFCSLLEEHLSPSAWIYTFNYVVLGFTGVGSL